MTHQPQRTPPATRLEAVLAAPADEAADEAANLSGGTRIERSPVAGKPAQPQAKPLRPVHRPPMALLCAVDDGLERGEWFRLRRPRTVIGRTEGDIAIPHDEAMSGKHLEILRTAAPGGYRWLIRDLGSTNGTFFRVSGGLLRSGTELLLGSRRYAFELPTPGEGGQSTPAGTHMWRTVDAAQAAALRPRLVELNPGGPGAVVTLSADDVWLGASPRDCAVVIAGDPFVSPRHARLFCDKRGQWQIENADSANGVWVRVEELAVDNSGEFMAGEQRFLFKVL